MGLFNWIGKIFERESKEDSRRSELVAYELQEKIKEQEGKFTRERDYYFNKRPNEIIKRYYGDLSEEAQNRIQTSLEFEQRKRFSNYNTNYRTYEEKAFAVRNRLKEEEEKSSEYQMKEIARKKVRDYFEAQAKAKRDEVEEKRRILESRLIEKRRVNILQELAA